MIQQQISIFDKPINEETLAYSCFELNHSEICSCPVNWITWDLSQKEGRIWNIWKERKNVQNNFD